MDIIRIGTRGSRLALRQAGLVQEALLHAFHQIRTEIVILHTKGDNILDRPMNRIGGKGIFVSEFEQALLEDRIDLAVHSAKDLPMSLAEGLVIAAVLPRGDVRDVLVVPKGAGLPFFLQDPGGAGTSAGGRSGGKQENAPFIIGTGSIRRRPRLSGSGILLSARTSGAMWTAVCESWKKAVMMVSFWRRQVWTDWGEDRNGRSGLIFIPCIPGHSCLPPARGLLPWRPGGILRWRLCAGSLPIRIRNYVF